MEGLIAELFEFSVQSIDYERGYFSSQNWRNLQMSIVNIKQEKNFRKEIEKEEKIDEIMVGQSLKVLKILSSLCSLNTKKKRVIKNYLESINYDDSNLSIDNLKRLYWEISQSLTKKNSKASTPTNHENECAKYCRLLSRRKFFQNFWFGPYNIDIFFPQHRLSLEVDGEKHLIEGKSVKDSKKEDFLAKYKVATARIENHEIVSVCSKYMQEFEGKRHIGMVNLHRLWRNIIISTIAKNYDHDEISGILKLDFRKIVAIACGR